MLKGKSWASAATDTPPFCVEEQEAVSNGLLLSTNFKEPTGVSSPYPVQGSPKEALRRHGAYCYHPDSRLSTI